MSEQGDPLEGLRQELTQLFAEVERDERKRRAETANYFSSVAKESDDSASLRLTSQAVGADEIRAELVTAVFHLSNDEFAVWALQKLSPYSDALTLAEANLSVVKRNIKVLLREGK